MRKLLEGLLLLVVLVCPVGAWAQSPAPSCTGVNINGLNAGQDITCDATAGGITFLNPNYGRCSVTILNTSANTIRWYPVSNGTVSATVGFTLAGGSAITLGLGARGETLKCIRTGASSGTLNVSEEVQKATP